MSGYTKQTVWHFVASGVAYALCRCGRMAARVKERYPNGPECSQLNLVLWIEDGSVAIDEGDRKHGEYYGHDVGAIVAHIEHHGLPWELSDE